MLYFPAVHDCHELVAIKPAELTPAGRLHWYWEHLEDAHGFLTD
ncbi:hypothetical protein ABZX38_29510 [Streptomyces longwoodensis]